MNCLIRYTGCSALCTLEASTWLQLRGQDTMASSSVLCGGLFAVERGFRDGLLSVEKVGGWTHGDAKPTNISGSAVPFRSGRADLGPFRAVPFCRVPRGVGVGLYLDMRLSNISVHVWHLPLLWPFVRHFSFVRHLLIVRHLV